MPDDPSSKDPKDNNVMYSAMANDQTPEGSVAETNLEKMIGIVSNNIMQPGCRSRFPINLRTCLGTSQTKRRSDERERGPRLAHEIA